MYLWIGRISILTKACLAVFPRISRLPGSPAGIRTTLVMARTNLTTLFRRPQSGLDRQHPVYARAAYRPFPDDVFVYPCYETNTTNVHSIFAYSLPFFGESLRFRSLSGGIRNPRSSPFNPAAHYPTAGQSLTTPIESNKSGSSRTRRWRQPDFGIIRNLRRKPSPN